MARRTRTLGGPFLRDVAVPEYKGEVDGMSFTIEVEQEEDGRWLAEVIGLPGALVYGQTRDEAVARVQALALRVVAEQLEHGETALQQVSVSFIGA